MTPVGRHLRIALAEAIRAGREAIGWSVGELASHAGVSRAMVSMVESAGTNLTVDMAGRLLSTMGVTIDLRYQLPFANPRQRDAAHARCVAYVQRRLEGLGWLVRREVEVFDGRSRGWIDVLAWHPGTRTLLVIEVKTEILDLGRVERTIGWYRRLAVRVAHEFGWEPTTIGTWLLVLATESNEERIRENREALAQSFPHRGSDMLDAAADAAPLSGIALIDPRRRRRDWLLRARIDGRRSKAPYRDYAQFMFVAAGGAPLPIQGVSHVARRRRVSSNSLVARER